MPSHTQPRLRWAALLTAVSSVALIFVGAPAANAVAMNVSIQSTSATSQPSGSQYSYQVNFACLGTNAPSCTNAVLSIPLDGDVNMTGWAFEVTGGPAGFIESWSVDTPEELLTINLGDMNAGASQAITVRLTPPNLTTPNNTTWSLLPSITSPDATMDDTTAPTPATGVATATVPLSIAKSSPRSFYYEGTEVTYTVTTTCPSTRPVGSLYAESIRVVDLLPEGLTLVNPASYNYNPVTRELSWDISGAQLPAACGGPAGTPAASMPVVATVGDVGAAASDVFTSYQQVVNTASATAIPVGGTEPSAPQQASRTIVVLDAGDDPQPGTRSLGKSASGPLRHADAPAAPAGTYPGRWLPNGIDETDPALATGANPASYTLTPRVQFEEFQYEITDRMPCLEGGDRVFTSSADLCATPAFNPLAVRINYSGPAAPEGYAPQYVDNRDGQRHNLSASTGGSGWASWVIPTSAIGFVAELVIPRDSSQELRRSDNVIVYGFADESTLAGDVLQNRGEITWFLRSTETPYDATRTSNAADIHVLGEPQLGMQKSMANIGGVTGTEARVTLTGSLMSPGTPSEGVVITDLLPAGSQLVTPTSAVTAELRPTGGSATTVSAPALIVEALDDYEGSGRQLIRVTVPAEAFGGAGQYTVAVAGFTVTKPSTPGTYTNSAQVFYDNAGVLGFCSSGVYRSDDPADLRPDAVESAVNCEASTTFVSALSSEGQFTLAKTVKGDYDEAPVAFPAVGHVELESGTADYAVEWTNVGAPTLAGVVLYDVLPHVGDVGVSGSQSDESRGSEFRPMLASVGSAPAGVTVSYSGSDDPCRPEVYPSQPTSCVDDWTTDAAAFGGLSGVAAIRISSSSQYPTGSGITLGFQMSVPTVDRDQVAWNSVAAFAQTATGIRLEPSEAPKVGITASDKRFTLDKVAETTDSDRGESVAFTVTVSNAGTSVSEPTTVVDAMPEGLEYQSSTPVGVWNASDRTLTWEVAELDPNEVQEYTVVAMVASDAGTTLINRALLVNPADYSPVLVTNQCAGVDTEACAMVSIPSVPLAHAGLDSRSAIAAALLALVIGAAVLIASYRRRPAHRA